MNRLNGSVFWGLVAVAVVESAVTPASAGWFTRGTKNKPACTEPEQCVTTPVAPPSAPPVAAPSPPAAAIYQTPQATADISGSSQSVGIRGFGLRIPESNFQLPTIQLPSIVRYQRGSEAHFESARAPQISGMAAVPSQISLGGPAIPVAPPSAPAAPSQVLPPTPPNGGGATIPAAPNTGCVPLASNSSDAELQALRELAETRRILDLYRQELQEVKRSLENSTTASEEAAVPPSPAIRRTTFQGKLNSVPSAPRANSTRIVEAAYSEDEIAEDDQSARRSVPLRVRRPAEIAQPPRSSKNQSATESRRSDASLPSNTGSSYFVDDPDAESEGLGAWKGEQIRPISAGRNGNSGGKRASN